MKKEMGKCESCWGEVDPEKDIVEWLALSNDVCLSNSIRIAHKDCCFYNTEFEYITENNLFDRWLPLNDIQGFIDLALDMDWDNVYDAEMKLLEIMEEYKNG